MTTLFSAKGDATVETMEDDGRSPALSAGAQEMPSRLNRLAETVPSSELQSIAFRVPPVWWKRFRRRALEADLKLNALLFEAFAAWEEKHRLKD